MSVADLFDDARARLSEVPREHLGEIVQPKRILGVARAVRVAPRGHVWRLGVLLVGDDGVYSVGDVIRARAEVRRGFTAEAQRHRAEVAAAARRGGFEEGAVVHLGWTPIDLTAVQAGRVSGPLATIDGVVSVRWSAGGGYVPLEAYVEERLGLAG
ncbi:glutaminase [Microbacterium koreense]|uniref:Glutaminase n=1 Tax=Microbacterium koreense TaxID=323761 RepID=A0ABW2ZMM9_9MICO